MEILATGEKIKRARIYKGLTLKDICGDKLSISKLSCIENDKIKAEPEILQYISKKLDIDYDYLTESTKTQLERNLKMLKSKKSIEGYEDALKYNLDFSLKNNYYDLAFEFIHILFSYYLEGREVNKILDITSTYYHICYKSGENEHYFLYYCDMGKYLFSYKEYDQAIIYYNMAKNILENNNYKDDIRLAEVLYFEILCYVFMKKFNCIDKLTFQLETLVGQIEDNEFAGKIYHLLAGVFIFINEDKFMEYEKKTYELYNDNPEKMGKAKLDFAFSMLHMNLRDKAIEYIREGLELCSRCDEAIRVNYIIGTIGALMEYDLYDLYDLAEELCDEALNYAIQSGNVKYIDRAYYYKAIFLEKRAKYEDAEMYMNLSLDALFKYGGKSEKVNKYMDIANMYYKLGAVKDALKYLTLAMKFEDPL